MAKMVSTSKNAERQYPLAVVQSFTYADIPTTATAYELIDLPQGSVVTGGWLIVDTAWNTATTATLDIGDTQATADPDRYTSSPVDLKTVGATALTNVDGKEFAATGTVDGTTALVGAAASAGAARLIVEYVISGRGNENQG